jgi:hypothetical protein
MMVMGHFSFQQYSSMLLPILPAAPPSMLAAIVARKHNCLVVSAATLAHSRT